MKRFSGFTLIEVLIALLLLSIVMFIGSYSFSVFSQRWQSDMGDFTQQAERAKKLFLLQRSIRGMSNYFVLDDKKDPVYLFLGNSSNIVFVSNTPIFSTDTPALVRLTIIPREDGMQQLVYQESSFEHSPLFSLNNLPAAEQSLVILTASNIRFNYFGWDSIDAKLKFYDIDVTERAQPIWQDTYLAQDILILPYAINLTWGNNEPIIMPIANDNAFQLIYTNEKRNGI